MFKPGVLNSGEKIEYAFGITVSKYRGVQTFGHSGADAGYRSEFRCFPDQRFAVIIFCNLGMMTPDVLARKVADVYLGDHLEAAEPEPEIINLSKKQLAAHAGIYRDPKTGGTRRFELRGDQLVAVFTPDFALPLAATAPHQFTMLGFPAKLKFTNHKDKRELNETFGSGKPTVYQWVDVPKLTKKQYKEYVGTFYSEELDTQYQIEQAAHGLVCKHYKHKTVPLTPSATDAFMGVGDLQFTRDKSGKVDGFNWYTGRIRKQHFERVYP
jgi:hypothetical protein